MTVLCLVGMELTFLTAANMALYFGFLVKTLLITHQCLGHCWTVLAVLKLPLFPHCPTQWTGWGWTREGTQPGQAASWPKGYSTWYSIMFRNKTWGREEEGKFGFQGHCWLETGWTLVHSWEVGSYYLWVIYLPHPLHPTFFHLLNCLISTHIFWVSLFLSSPLSHWGMVKGSDRGAVWVLGYCQG